MSAIEKSSLLAVGISAAMNATLVGLSVSVLTVIAYAFLKARLENIMSEIDRYAVAVLNLLNPPSGLKSPVATSMRRGGHGDEEAADADVTPMLNLMVILIPVLLTSSEFVKVGNIEIKLPETQGGAGEGTGAEETPEPQETKLELGVIITAKGFNLLHYFQGSADFPSQGEVDIPLVDGKYDYDALNQQLARVKRRALFEIVKAYVPDTPPTASLPELYNIYASQNLSGAALLPEVTAEPVVQARVRSLSEEIRVLIVCGQSLFHREGTSLGAARPKRSISRSRCRRRAASTSMRPAQR